MRAGTPAYMAPEQLAGAEVTRQSDIYALGLVLYELFTGQRAIEAKNVAELLRKREAGIVPPSQRRARPRSRNRSRDPALSRARSGAIARRPRLALRRPCPAAIRWPRRWPPAKRRRRKWWRLPASTSALKPVHAVAGLLLTLGCLGALRRPLGPNAPHELRAAGESRQRC